MTFELLIVVFAGLGAAGLVALPFRLVGRKMPKTIMLVAAALAMLGYTVWSRHTWADRVEEGLPAGSRILAAYPYQGVLEPWTAWFPRTGSLLVLDGAATLRHPSHPDLALVTTRLMEQNVETLNLVQVVDCNRKRRAPVAGPETLGADGLPKENAWIEGGEPVALFEAVCAK